MFFVCFIWRRQTSRLGDEKRARDISVTSYGKRISRAEFLLGFRFCFVFLKFRLQRVAVPRRAIMESGAIRNSRRSSFRAAWRSVAKELIKFRRAHRSIYTDVAAHYYNNKRPCVCVCVRAPCRGCRTTPARHGTPRSSASCSALAGRRIDPHRQTRNNNKQSVPPLPSPPPLVVVRI